MLFRHLEQLFDLLFLSLQLNNYIKTTDVLNPNGVIKQEALPAGFPYAEYGTILPETTVTYDDGIGGANIEGLTLESGVAYGVLWNGDMYFCESKLNSDSFKIKKHLIKVIQKLRSHYRFHYNKLGKMRRILCFSVASSIYLALKCFTINMNQANHSISKIYSFQFKPT